MARKKKERKKKKRRKKHYLLKFTLLVICCVGLYYFLTSDYFNIQKITIVNDGHYTNDQVVEIAKAKAGKNLFKVSTKKMKERLLEDAYIKSAKVRRSIPKTLKITVEERKPYAIVPYGDDFIIIDQEAIVLEKSDGQPQLPLLLGMTLKSIEPGEMLKVEESSVLEDTLSLLERMEEEDLYFKKIDISNIIIKAYIYDQLVCEGTPDNIFNNMDKIKLTISNLYGQNIRRGTIKVTDGNAAFTGQIE